MKIENLYTDCGNPIANQFIITDGSGSRVFQSYETTIAKRDTDGQVYLDEKYWDYSRTTGKYRNQFLGETITETRKKIQSGEYKLADLN